MTIRMIEQGVRGLMVIFLCTTTVSGAAEGSLTALQQIYDPPTLAQKQYD
jgi:hypothetical protein